MKSWMQTTFDWMMESSCDNSPERIDDSFATRLGITNFVGKLQNVDFGDDKYGQTEARQLAASKELLH